MMVAELSTILTARHSYREQDVWLMLPDHPDFHRVLASPPPTADKSQNFIIPAGQHVLKPVDQAELDEYLEGGEYTERLAEVGEYEEDEGSEFLYLPSSFSIGS